MSRDLYVTCFPLKRFGNFALDHIEQVCHCSDTEYRFQNSWLCFWLELDNQQDGASLRPNLQMFAYSLSKLVAFKFKTKWAGVEGSGLSNKCDTRLHLKPNVTETKRKQWGFCEFCKFTPKISLFEKIERKSYSVLNYVACCSNNYLFANSFFIAKWTMLLILLEF